MASIYKQIIETLDEFNLEYDLCLGANLAGFKKVANAMIYQGVY